MLSINAIIFSDYMFCEVYRSDPWRHGYPPSGPRGFSRLHNSARSEKKFYVSINLFLNINDAFVVQRVHDKKRYVHCTLYTTMYAHYLFHKKKSKAGIGVVFPSEKRICNLFFVFILRQYFCKLWKLKVQTWDIEKRNLQFCVHSIFTINGRSTNVYRMQCCCISTKTWRF